ncbi:MAG: class I SAM-dependent methyltransferase [Acidobacteriota bacterium]|nr:class I SAM-dependent methyltransferase [Acidobacteriota bacterium]
MRRTEYRCPDCFSELDEDASTLRCRRCSAAYPVENQIADFAGGAYYDNFKEPSQLSLEHIRGLELENEGATTRIAEYYLPLIGASSRSRVLDAGCGNGISVDLLQSAGYEAWGVDLSLLRRWQWRERTHRDHLAVASGMKLPFADAFFDVVLSSGVIEHVGVREQVSDRYTVTVLPDRDAQRRAFISELLRVLIPGGSLYLDAPNGAFPIDFWHNRKAGQPRWHSTREGFLPTFAEIWSLAQQIDPGISVRAVSPNGRLAFRQAGQHWYGRLLTPPMRLLFRLMDLVPGLSRSFLNPFLVVRITKPSPES